MVVPDGLVEAAAEGLSGTGADGAGRCCLPGHCMEA